MASTEPLILAAKNGNWAEEENNASLASDRKTNCNRKENQRYQLVPKKRLHLDQLTIDLIDNGLIVIDPNGLELGLKENFM
jgi:hypothetical protein